MKPIIAGALICAALVTLCVLYVDRPVASFVAAHDGYLLFYDALASPSLLALPFACVYAVFHTQQTLTGRRKGAHADLLLALTIAIAFAAMAKDELKWLIGRPWPQTWVKYGVYTLKPFTDSQYFGSFPSGHTTYVAAPMFVLWWRLPRYRLLWLGIVLMVMVGLVGSNNHFVADVIAGFFLGLAAAAGTVTLMPANQKDF